MDLYPKNVIFLTAKKFIFNCSRKNKALNLVGFKGYVKTIYQDEKYIPDINDNSCNFLATWSTLVNAISA